MEPSFITSDHVPLQSDAASRVPYTLSQSLASVFFCHNGCVRCCCFCRCCCCSCCWCCSCCYCFPCSNSSCSPLLLVLLVLLLLLLTVLKCPVPGRVISGPAGTRSARRRRTRSIPLKVFSLHIEERFHTHGYGVFWRLKSFPLRLVQ